MSKPVRIEPKFVLSDGREHIERSTPICPQVALHLDTGVHISNFCHIRYLPADLAQLSCKLCFVCVFIAYITPVLFY